MTRETDQPAAAPASDETFLQRWSRRKHGAERDAVSAPAPSASEPALAAPPAKAGSTAVVTPAEDTVRTDTPAPLPPVESLTFESDFRAFLEPHVAEDVKRQALRKLLHDPRFNVMDGLDVYIDDYSVPSPLAPELVRTLAQARYIFDPPQTRVNAAGHVEDVPVAETEALAEGDTTEDGAFEDLAAEKQATEETASETLASPAAESALLAESPAQGAASS
jgi:hypothetical protein